MEEQYQVIEQHENILDEVGPHLVLATTGKRFANYLIDIFTFYIFYFILIIIIGITFPNVIALIEEDSIGVNIIDRLIGLFMYGLFMGVVEGIGKGRSLGKLITGTKAVNEDSSTISWSTAMRRGFSRMVPFEAFSGLTGYPWHDKWTDTYVIDINKSRL